MRYLQWDEIKGRRNASLDFFEKFSKKGLTIIKKLYICIDRIRHASQ